MSAGTIVIAAIIVVIVLIIMMSIKLVPQGTAAVIERLGRYTKTVEGGITFLIPFVDRVRSRVDTRERVVSFPPQAVITQDNLTVAIDTVVTFQINDPMHSIYGVDNYLTGVEQTTTATLRDVVGGMTLEETLTSLIDGSVVNWITPRQSGGCVLVESSSKRLIRHRRFSSRWKSR